MGLFGVKFACFDMKTHENTQNEQLTCDILTKMAIILPGFYVADNPSTRNRIRAMNFRKQHQSEN
jgi:hypothetical protein